MSAKDSMKKLGNSISSGVKDYFNVTDHENDPERLSPKNLIMFSLGTFGRDFVYNLFSAYLLSYIMFTKHFDNTNAAMGIVTAIVMAARIFDAFNDPIMGGIVDNTRSKYGKFKPWQLIGALLTGGVVIAMFSNNLQGDNFLILLGVLYFLWSITFTMNDISYWGMMPSLSSNEIDRSKIASFAQLVAAAGGGLAGLLIPIFTTGELAIKGSAVYGYMFISIVAVLVMIGFQLFTIFGVKEKPLPKNFEKQPRMKLKDMFKVIFKNDQLLWSTLIMLMFCTGTDVVNAGLSMNYIYFEFGYSGDLTIWFFAIFSVFNVLFTILYPILVKKFGRDKLLYTTGFSLIIGYILMLIFGLAIPTGAFHTSNWWAKYILMILSNGFVGFGKGFYMVLMLCMANTVEYNEYKTGDRKESLIFSLRPLTAKLSSALQQGIVYVIFFAAGAYSITNGISEIESHAAVDPAYAAGNKLSDIEQLLSTMDPKIKTIILCCMCLIPIVTMLICMFIYKKKYFLTDEKYAEICKEIKARNEAKLALENVGNEESGDVATVEETVDVDETLANKVVDINISDVEEINVDEEINQEAKDVEVDDVSELVDKNVDEK